MDNGELWSFLRDVLTRGAAIQTAYAASNYELYSARMDAAASELADKLEVKAKLRSVGKLQPMPVDDEAC